MRCSLPAATTHRPTHTQFGFLQEFFFDSLLFEYEVPRYRFFFLLLTTWCSWGFLDLWFDSAFVWEITWVFTIDTSGISFVSFFLLLIFPLHVYYTFVVVPQFLDILGVLFWFFFLFAFQFWKFLLMYLQASWFSSPPCPVRWWAHQTHYSFLFSATSYLLMSLPFNFLLKARHDILDIKNQVK